jgi:hypothetical protein
MDAYDEKLRRAINESIVNSRPRNGWLALASAAVALAAVAAIAAAVVHFVF